MFFFKEERLEMNEEHCDLKMNFLLDSYDLALESARKECCHDA